MKERPTLFDSLVVEFSKKPHDESEFLTKSFVRRLKEARRFVLDEEMSTFSADLAHRPFEHVRSEAVGHRLLDELRCMARLPHAITWIEYDNRARAKRAIEYGMTEIDPLICPKRAGWLVMQHSEIDTAFIATDCRSGISAAGMDNPQISGVAYQWRSVDEPMIWNDNDTGGNAAAVLTGFKEYRSKFAGAALSPFHKYRVDVNFMSQGVGCELRYLWALLAAINDVPTEYEIVRPSRGYVSQGRYKKYMEHTIIHLKVPHKVPLKTLAAKTLAIARRRAHQVRGHWRRNYRKPGERIWIKEHQRGDASLGFVLHDYSVEKGASDAW